MTSIEYPETILLRPSVGPCEHCRATGWRPAHYLLGRPLGDPVLVNFNVPCLHCDAVLSAPPTTDDRPRVTLREPARRGYRSERV